MLYALKTVFCEQSDSLSLSHTHTHISTHTQHLYDTHTASLPALYARETAFVSSLTLSRARSRSLSHTHTHMHSVFTTLVAAMYALRTVVREQPDLVLCNGPGTCVPVAYAAWLMRLVRVKSCSIVFTVQCVAVCCSALQCVAVCCSVL